MEVSMIIANLIILLISNTCASTPRSITPDELVHSNQPAASATVHEEQLQLYADPHVYKRISHLKYIPPSVMPSRSYVDSVTGDAPHMDSEVELEVNGGEETELMDSKPAKMQIVSDEKRDGEPNKVNTPKSAIADPHMQHKRPFSKNSFKKTNNKIAEIESKAGNGGEPKSSIHEAHLNENTNKPTLLKDPLWERYTIFRLDKPGSGIKNYVGDAYRQLPLSQQ